MIESEVLKSLKIAYIFIITAVVYVALIPAFSKRCRNNETTLGVMNSFAGGVFLSMSLIHILPEANEMYTEAMAEEEAINSEETAEEHAAHAEEESGEEEHHEEDHEEEVHAESHAVEAEHDEHDGHSDLFPLPYLVFFLGYATVLLIDRVLSSHFGHSHGHSHGTTVKVHKHVNGRCVESHKRKKDMPFERRESGVPNI